MGRYSKRLADKIFALYRSDEFTETEVCRKVGVSRQAMHTWKNKYPEFKKGIEDAKMELIDERLVECRRSLAKLINGYEYEEETTEYIRGMQGRPEVRAQRVVKKTVPPNLGAIIHFQTNRDSENWANKQRTEITGKDGEEFKLRPLTKEEIEILKNGL